MAKRQKPKPQNPKLDPETGWEIDDDIGDLIDPETDDVLSRADAMARINERKAAAEAARGGERPPATQPIPNAEVARASAASMQPAVPAAEAAKTEETRTCVFPRKVILTRDDHTKVTFDPGTQEVPVSLAGKEPDGSDMHAWLKANEVTLYTKG